MLAVVVELSSSLGDQFAPRIVYVQARSQWKRKWPLICARTRLREDDARDSSRISEVHGYWMCSAYHFNGAALRLPAQAIGQKLGRFPYDFLNENHRHRLHCGVVGCPRKHY